MSNPNSKANPNKKRKKYNVVTKKGSAQEQKLNEIIQAQNVDKYVSLDDVDFTTVQLTDEEAQELTNAFDPSDDEQGIAENRALQLPPVNYQPLNDDPNDDGCECSASTFSIASANAADVTSKSILTKIPTYPNKLYGQDVIILDSLIYQNIPSLNGFKVKVLASFVGSTPCLSHGTNVAEVIAQEFKPENTDLQFINVAVFDCNGSSQPSTIANGVRTVLDYKKGPGKDRDLTVNFSGGGPSDSVINKVFKQLTKRGIDVVVAAGNESQNCVNSSPANASINSAIQSIGSMQGQVKADYSNYSTNKPCVDLYLPGCLPMTNPDNGRRVLGCGTSFSAPLQTGRVLVYKSLNGKANPLAVKRVMRNNAFTVTDPNGYRLRTISEAMAFSWGAQKQQAKANSVEKDVQTKNEKKVTAR